MHSDYRNTRYCPELDDLHAKKNEVADMVKKDYPKARDMHTYISKNDARYKMQFCEAYNFKCAYCGISFSLLPKEMFEIDHFIYEKSSVFNGSKAAAGYIENLLLSCHSCNHKKSSFEFNDANQKCLNPDNTEIRNVFKRDDDYYIKVSKDFDDNQEVIDFYKQVKLGSELRRLDFLLMNMIGLLESIGKDSSIYGDLSRSIEKLRLKRNMM